MLPIRATLLRVQGYVGDGYRELIHVQRAIDHHADHESLVSPQALRKYGLAGDGVGAESISYSVLYDY